MKRCAHAYAMCRSMFCFIPSPWRVWDEEARPLMLLFLPVVGLEIGALWWGLAWLVRRFALPLPVAALLLAAWPIVSTGAMHLDGFMDVMDAVHSCADAERRRQILKDPHAGSFAVVGCVLVLLALWSLFSVGRGHILLLLLIPVVSRCCCALAVLLLPPMTTSQYAAQKLPRDRAAVLLLMLLAALALGFVLCGTSGFALPIGAVCCVLALYRGYRALGGMNGDISGYALTVGELCAVAAFAFL